MNKIIFIILSYICLFINSSLFADENNNHLKIGLLAPFSGEYKNLGNSLLLSTQLALEEIDDKRIKIIPRDTGSNNKIQFNNAIKEIIDSGANIIIGPVDDEYFEELKKNCLLTINLTKKEYLTR